MSYVPMPTAKTGSSSMAFKIMTFVGAALAVCLLLASVLMGVGAHSRSARAEETRSNAESLRRPSATRQAPHSPAMCRIAPSRAAT